MCLICPGTLSNEFWYAQNTGTSRLILMYPMRKNSEFVSKQHRLKKKFKLSLQMVTIKLQIFSFLKNYLKIIYKPHKPLRLKYNNSFPIGHCGN